MSRKWEKQVEKNRDRLNKQREKSGKTKIVNRDQDGYLHKGRSIVLPVFLLCVAMFFGYSMYIQGEVDGLYWFTLISYILLSAFFYFIKRPYLKIGRGEVATRKFFGREKVIKASELEKVIVQRGMVVISFKGKKLDWAFNRFLNRFDTEAISEQLEKFTHQHGIPFENKS